MTILIITNPRDSDSFIVQEALERKGHSVKLVHTSEFPQRAQLEIACSNSTKQWALSGPEMKHENKIPDSVWWRRPTKPTLPEWVHPDDSQFAALECESFQDAFWETLSRMGSFWVNPLDKSRLADNKILQQQLAIDCGLETPPSLYSNDPHRIRSFIKAMGGRAVYKPFRPLYAVWTENGRSEGLYTSIVEDDVLPADEVLRVTPGIFQKLIPKKFELRVVVMGRKIFAFRIDAPEGSRGKLDWRSAYHELELQRAFLPAKIEEALLLLLQRLGIVTGSCDLIVTPDDRTVFIEVNESGQFLWLERYVEFPLLDAFCELLAQHRIDFDWEPTSDSLHVTHVLEDAKARMRNALGFSPDSE